MRQKIYYGSIEVRHKKTGAVSLLSRMIFKELDNPQCEANRGYYLKNIPKSERINYEIVRFCFETAIVTGETAY